ncbi:MAG: sigma-70 family RNA polymerase sigma factor [Fimbriiglobus sp.]
MSFIGVFRRWQQLAEEGDADCLDRYCAGRDAEAFTRIMARYSGLVWAVCRRQLRSPADIEDAYQTTFLVLATKPNSIRDPAALGSWLHGTAWRVATKIRQRRRHESLPDAAAPEDRLTEALQALDDELLQLPSKYREPIILCYLQELTQDQAAQNLGLSRSTLKRRLESGRERLRLRLERRGFELGGILALAALGTTATAATTTTAAAILTMATALPAHLKPLLQGVIWTMFLEKIRLSIVVVALTGVTLTGLGLGLVTVTAQGPTPAAGTTPTPKGGIAPSPTKPPVTPTPSTAPTSPPNALPPNVSDEIERLEHEIAIQDLRIEAAKEKIKMEAQAEKSFRTNALGSTEYSAARIEAIKAKENIIVAERTKRLAEKDIARLRSEKPAEVKTGLDTDMKRLMTRRLDNLQECIKAMKGTEKGLDFSEFLEFVQVHKKCRDIRLLLAASHLDVLMAHETYIDFLNSLPTAEIASRLTEQEQLNSKYDFVLKAQRLLMLSRFREELLSAQIDLLHAKQTK